ncbi:MAG: hypothetical protein B5M51_04980 [Anaerolinea sp. 4484_236]|nr:MAG: hypothetical protein B5M51_04980 [Anaerolinea sp. 4484_236]RLD11721.1 MAG: hypothetical protein DRI56_00370 [Chloroflexota bacterium]
MKDFHVTWRGEQFTEGKRLVGEVSETGIGIPPEDQGHLFSEFFRAKNAKELGIQGTGLGLAIIRRVVEVMNGEITVESEIGRGSTFKFAIPVYSNLRSRQNIRNKSIIVLSTSRVAHGLVPHPRGLQWYRLFFLPPSHQIIILT